MTRKAWVLSVYLLLFMSSYPLLMVYGQGICPFSEQEAVADTLDPVGYLPMQIGNVWEYTIEDGAFSDDPYREEVMSDTLIENVLFYKIRRISFDYDPVIITHADTSYSYQAITDTSIVFWRNGTIDPSPVRFSQEFNSCYEPSSGGQIVVVGGYDQSFDIEYEGEIQTLEVHALKEIGSTFLGITYAWGIGKVKSLGDPSVKTTLVYARVGGVEYGVPLAERFSISVSNEPDNVFPQSRGIGQVESFPNPFYQAVTIRYNLQSGRRVNLVIYNLLGQEIRELISEFQSPGQREAVWEGVDNSGKEVPVGVYLYNLQAGEVNQSGFVVFVK